MSISYCISVCDEDKEFNKLLEQLIPHIDAEDEIIILVDESKVTTEVGQVIAKWKTVFPLEVIATSLNGDFSTFKNNFIGKATKDFLWQLDADEGVCDELLVDIKLIIEANPNIDLYWISRENYVEGIKERPDLIAKWGWKIDEKDRINYNDPQSRIFRNNKSICWINKVHEQIVGHKEFSVLPQNYYLIHNKSLERQIEQNEMYASIKAS